MSTQKINNFSCLIKNNIYKVTDLQYFKTDYNPKQAIYTLESGLKLFGRPGINEQFATFSIPFYFRYKGQADELFKRYKFNTFKDSDALVTENHDEILEILINYVTDKVCEGCVRGQPADEPPRTHSCLLETRIEQAKQYLTVALYEHPKYEVGDIVDAFVNYRTNILGRSF